MKTRFPRLNRLQFVPVLLFTFVLSMAARGQAPDVEATSEKSNAISLSVEATTQPGNFHTPLDSTPDPLGNFIYFVAIGKHGPGVFRVAAAANSPVVEIAAGYPLVAPTGIAFSSDGLTIYITDAQAWSDDGVSGQIFALPANGGTPLPLPGAAGTKPRNLDVIGENGRDVIYYSGQEPRRLRPAIFKLAINAPNTLRIVAQGAPLVAPDGIAVTRTGIVYVADRASAGYGRGNVFRLNGRSIRPITSAVQMGNPAGIALTLDDSTLLVSSHQRNGYDQVLVVDLRTLRTQVFTDVVGENLDAGGLHRAHDRDIYSWIDSTSGGQGTVYLVRPRP